jgi:uncharacterized protein (UPF0332 family)
VSPRSDEFFQQATGRLDDARLAAAHDRRETALSTAYYACLYAARAALSEEDRYAKTHRGTWSGFHEAFVRTARFDPGLHGAAAALQRDREEVDYEAAQLTREEMESAIEAAERFVAAVRALID